MTRGDKAVSWERLSTWSCTSSEGVGRGSLDTHVFGVRLLVAWTTGMVTPANTEAWLRARSCMPHRRPSITFITCGTRDGLNRATSMVTEFQAYSEGGQTYDKGKWHRWTLPKEDEAVVMTFAQKYLARVRTRGEAKAELRKVSKIVRCCALSLMAYAKLSANTGAQTPGVDPQDVVDGMSLDRINHLIRPLEEGNDTWKPVRRVYIKKANGQRRP